MARLGTQFDGKALMRQLSSDCRDNLHSCPQDVIDEGLELAENVWIGCAMCLRLHNSGGQRGDGESLRHSGEC